MEYTPDKWLIVEIKGDTPHYRVFATWSGGYTDGDSWKFNSGIKSFSEDDSYYYFNGYSGSVYKCRKGSYDSTSYGWYVLQDIIDGSSGLAILELEEDGDWKTKLTNKN